MAQDSGNNVNIEFGATTDDAESKIKSLGDSIKESLGQAGDSFSSFSTLSVAAGVAIESLGEKIIQSLGENIREAIRAFSDLGDQLEHMQHRLGTSAEELSVLKVGLESVGISTGTFESIARRLPMVMEKNIDKFKEAKIAYADANGAMLPVQDIISNITEHLEKFSAGSARNQEGVRLLGRAFFMMADTVEITKERMKEASDVAQQFGLVLSEEDLEATDLFGRQVNLLQSALKGFYVEVGRNITPALTELAMIIRDFLVPVFDIFSVVIDTFKQIIISLWDVVKSLADLFMVAFSNIGDIINAIFGSGGEGVTAIEFFTNVLAIAQIAIIGFRNGFVTVFAAITYVLETATIRLKQFSGVAISALSLDWNGVKAAWNKGEADLSAALTRMTNKVVSESTRAQAEMQKLASGQGLHAPGIIKPSASGGGTAPTGKTPTGSGAASDGRLAEWRRQIKEMTEVEEHFFKDSLKKEEAFWAAKLASVSDNSKKNIKIRQEINSILFNIHKQQAQQELTQDLQDMKQQSEAYKAGSAERIRIAGEIAIKMRTVYGEESTQYKAALKDMEKAADDHNKQLEKLSVMKIDRVMGHAMNEIEMEKVNLARRRDLNEISAVEELEALRALKEKEYQLWLQAERDKIALMDLDVVAQQAAYDKLEEAAEQHAIDMKKVDEQIGRAKFDEINKWMKPINEAFADTVKGIIQGTTTLKEGIDKMADSIVLKFTEMCLNMLTEWLATQMQMQMQSVIGSSGGGGILGGILGSLSAFIPGMTAGGSGGNASPGIPLSAFKPPALATGTNYVPQDMLAVIHRGEEVVPAEYNPANGYKGGGGVSVVNNFTVTGAVNTKSQQQIALQVGNAVQRSRARNG